MVCKISASAEILSAREKPDHHMQRRRMLNTSIFTGMGSEPVRAV